jgi:DNA polymerase-3 subunit beta
MIKFSINKSAFVTVLRVAKQAIGSKIAIPVLSKFKLTVSDEGILITASNGQVSIEKWLPKDDKEAGMMIESEGTILVEANFFDSIVSQLPELTLEFEEIENEQVLVRSGKSEITLKGQSSEFYPMIQAINNKPFAKISVGQLKEIFNETAFAASTQESRPILTGLHLLLVDHQNLVAVATDSHRLSQRYTKLESFGEDFKVVIPKRAVDGFKNIFNNDEEIISLYFSGNQMLFKNQEIGRAHV